MKILILYSSVTGNTRYLAESIKSNEHEIFCLPVENYLGKNACQDFGFDCIFLGFWVYRGKPDLRILRIMRKLREKNVAVFGTLSAYPDSPHAQNVIQSAKENLSQNKYLGDFLCLGRLAQKRYQEKFSPDYHNPKHPMTAKRKKRLEEGQKHPNQDDCGNFQAFFNKILKKID